MGNFKLFASCLLLVMITPEKSFVDTAPTPAPIPTPSPTPTPSALKSTQKGSPEVVPETLDANVRELESLKQTIGKTLEMIKSQSSVYSNMNGHSKSYSEAQSEVREDGKLLADISEYIDKEQPSGDAPASGSLRIDVDIPEKNIHRSSVRLLPDMRGQQQASAKRSYAGRQEEDIGAPGAFAASRDAGTMGKFGDGQYTPLDMAEYVFWTGDEKGVTLAIEEFLQAGLLTREEAIAFLQEIKYNLDYLQNHYNTQLGLNSIGDRTKITDNLAEQLMKNALPDKMRNDFDLTKLRYQPTKKMITATTYDIPKEPEVAKQQADDDYDELIDRLKVADFLYTEYSLEEVIYQLAKVMFTEGLTHGSAEAQAALQKFTAFLETEAEQGHISRTLEKKVLDVLIASLTDTLSEHPEIEAIREYAQDEDRRAALRQLVQMIPPLDKTTRAKRVDLQLAGAERELSKYQTIG